jgi:hypothetical protein
MAVFGALVLAVLVGSGCVSEPGGGSSSGTTLGVTQDAGAIEGVVVSDALMPLANVGIGLDGSENTTFTGDDGRFVLELLAPGTHTVTFVREDLQAATRKIDVEAGRASRLQVQLAPRPSNEAYVRVEPTSGFIGCTFTLRDPVLSPQGRAKAAICTAIAQFGGGTAFDNSYIIYAPEAFDDIGDVVGEASWVSTQALGRGLFMNYWFHHPKVHLTANDAWDVNWSAGPSPIRVRVPVERIREVIKTNAAPGTAECAATCNLFAVLYSFPQTATSAPVDIGFAMQQKFELYRSTSFHGRLASDYTALPDT